MNKIPFLIGCEKNVLKRFYDAACFLEANHIVRITADCPFVDPELIDIFFAKLSVIRDIRHLHAEV